LIDENSSPEHQNEGGNSEIYEAVSKQLSQNLKMDIKKFRQKDRSGSSDTI
jgi:hypothetical protein